MSAMSLRLPESLHKAVREIATRENILIIQFVTLALAEKHSILMTQEYLEKRAKRAERGKFDAALRKVADVGPEEQDSL